MLDTAFGFSYAGETSSVKAVETSFATSSAKPWKQRNNILIVTIEHARR
jgi:hypothetical protein